jgi:very-short-patch-repair endonuclease
MWKLLRGSALGFKFRREHEVEGYRLDFYCHEALLVVELDGEQHDPERDQARDRVLVAHELLVYRIPNRRFSCWTTPIPTWTLGEIRRLCEERAGRKASPEL